MKNIITIWDKVVQILTIVISIATAVFAYLTIRVSKRMAKEQIEFSKELNKQEIMLGRPIISCTGNIGILDEMTFNLNIIIKNIGKRPLINFSIEYFVLSRILNEIISEYNEKFLYANQFAARDEISYYERLPRSNSEKEIFYKLKFQYEDTLTKSKEIQEFYYIFPKEQQTKLEKGEMKNVPIFGARKEDIEFIESNLK